MTKISDLVHIQIEYYPRRFSKKPITSYGLSKVSIGDAYMLYDPKVMTKRAAIRELEDTL